MSVINITVAAELGIRSLVALQRNRESMTTEELSSKLGASGAHISKVLQRLRIRGFVQSVRGPHGGYAIAKDAKKITPFHVIVAIDGMGAFPRRGRKCTTGGYEVMVNSISKSVVAHLKKYSIWFLAGR